jgi:oligopeptide/dipeptide ABC transporter ATP-binding protein
MTLASQGSTVQADPSPNRPPTSDDRLVHLHDVYVHYPVKGLIRRDKHRVVKAVDGVTLSIPKGQTLGLVGATGSGKSTIAYLIMGMVPPTGGTVSVLGRDPSTLRGAELLRHRRQVQVVMQDPYSSLDPRMKVADIIAEPLTLGRLITRRSDAVQARVLELLSLVGLSPSKAELYPHQFSGGQRQRVAIARALAPRPDLIVLDEPTSALDVSVRAQILKLLKGLQDRLGLTYLVISHDLITVAYLASRVAVMHLGRVVETGSTESIYASTRHPYTQLLLGSAPTADGSFITRLLPQVDTSTVPVTPTACRYAPRCDLRAALRDPTECLTVDPPLVEVGPGHEVACHFSDVVEFAARR